MEDSISKNVMIASGEFEKEKNYWLDKLSGELTISGFSPGYHPGEPELNSHIAPGKRAVHRFCFPEKIYKEFIHISGDSPYGIFILLLTGLDFLLAKYSGNRDIIVGAPVLKQRAPGDYFNHLVVLRTKVEAEFAFKDLVLQVKQTVSEAYQHMNYPFDEIAKLLGIPFDPHHYPLFETAIVSGNLHDIDGLNPQKCTAVFTFSQAEGCIESEVDYDPARLGRGMIESLAQHLINYFRQVWQNPQVRLSEIDILSVEEKRQILWDFNQTAADYPKHKTLVEIFTERVEKNSLHIAVVGPDRQHISYGELNIKSSRLAGRLREKHGVREGDIVGLYLPRSIEMIIGLLGTLKAGAACLPIDSRYPEKRVKLVLEDSGARMVLKSRLAVCGLAGPGEVRGTGHRNIKGLPPALNPAYVIYTSGSTNKPKGVLLHHRGIINHMCSLVNVFGIGEEDDFCHTVSSSFVVSIFQTFAPFYLGRCLRLYPGEVMGDPFQLFGRAASDGVTVLEIVPSLLNAYLKLIETGKRKVELSRVRMMILTGEELLPSLVDRFYRYYDIPLVNAYGQSEYSDDTLFYRVPRGSRKETGSIPVGKPAHNTWVYILDLNFQPQPVGVAGELYVGGDGLAIGYLNRVELTAEKFILAHSSWLIADKREKKARSSVEFPMSYELSAMSSIFKTGDLVLWQPDGNIRFLGRVDHQVKIRGFRVEPGEIETYLLQHKGIQAAAVVPKQDKKNNQHLYAYIVPAKDSASLAAVPLTEYLAAELPGYMIPSAFILLEEMPLLPNGKVDRKYLSQLEAEPLKPKMTYIAPKTNLEKQIAGVWQEVLNLEEEKVGTDVSFFQVGGTSLDILAVNRKLEALLGSEIPMVNMFKYPTIGALARYLSRESGDETASYQPGKQPARVNIRKQKLEQRTRRIKGTENG
ncbi:MAG: amino acid adenylation domain-containing protein [Candidatus Aminicenantes bacterium]|nr:amino acid adenylation domain-containing protein [Candidatus Aminicenantes bacterium]NIM81016.1 amino acid adenylation domain-containing protein [Candidatus Aminicenantes bacterium]NIN20395.1 amino acid adenylation domain-containing protein [Candidatus Aminicenantes bacterium]NIN44168.1 amino acid adenylation domain-containing protein [Candidatus Aminicenantes bacterium]NIN86986.1 amino acid adenylation domain-containing protein [Candidatus Aminicenantes bacterium]